MIRAIGLVACLVAAFESADVLASIVRAMTFEQMKDYTSTLVRAEVLDKESLYITFRQQDNQGREFAAEDIWTRYELEIIDVLYGDVLIAEDAGRTIDLYLPGGIVDEQELWVSTGFDLEVEWDVVIHLRSDELNKVYFSAGSAQAVFLAREIDGKEVFVNLSDYPRIIEDRDSLSNLRDRVDHDDWVHPEKLSPITYDALKSIGQRLSR